MEESASEESVDRAIVSLERKLALGIPTELTFDEKRAIRHITTSVGGLKCVQGYAGTAKTQMLLAAQQAWKESGFKVVGRSALVAKTSFPKLAAMVDASD